MATEATPAGPLAAPRATPRLRRLPVASALLVVGVQIAYPLLHGGTRDAATVVVVVLFALTCVLHAAVSRGVAFAATLLAVTAGGGFAIELLGVHTGVPFGSYAYGTGLGPRWCGVPPVIGLAWTMLAWPSAIAARALVRGRWARVLVGAWALASADLFLDPQMVRAGYWTWHDPTPHLPGLDEVPLTNYAGWLLAALVMSAAVQRLLDGSPAAADDRLPSALFLWLWIGWVVALGVFLDLRAAAAWGALGMGSVAVPLAWRWARGSR